MDCGARGRLNMGPSTVTSCTSPSRQSACRCRRRATLAADGQPVTAILPTFHHVQSQFLRQLDEAEGLDLARVKVATRCRDFSR